MFILKNNEPTVEPKMLHVPEFRKIWERDRSKNKKQANKELAFIYFMADYKSEYNAYGLEKEDMIASDIMGDPKYEADDLIIEAIGVYEKMQETYSMRYVKSNRKIVDSIIRFYEDNLYSPGKKNFEAAALDKLVSSLAKFEKTMESIEKWEKKVQAEEESMQIRGGGKVGVFEDEDKATWIIKKGR